MAFVLSDNKKSYPPPPEGLLHCVCVDVVDLGLQENKFDPGKMVRKLRITWQTDERDETGRRYQVSKTMTASLHEKAGLRKTLEGWRGKKFTPDELKGFDIEKLLGSNAQLQLVHFLRDDGTKGYSVQAVVPPPKGVPALRPEDYERKQDRDGGGASGAPTSEESTPF